MGRADAKGLGTLPNANGTITRLAYAHAKAHGIDPRALLPTANLTIQQINDASARLAVRDQIRFLNLSPSRSRMITWDFILPSRLICANSAFSIMFRLPREHWVTRYIGSRAIAKSLTKAWR